MDFVIAVSYLFPCSLDYAKGDLSSVRSILYSVAKKIHQNFLYTKFVTVYIQIPDLPDINGKFLFLFQRLFPDDNIRLIDNIYDAAQEDDFPKSGFFSDSPVFLRYHYLPGSQDL